MKIRAYRDTSEFKGLTRRGWDEHQLASGLVIVTPKFDEVLLVQRDELLSYGGMWSAPGGYRLRDSSGLESSLDCAVGETIEEIGRLPEGRIRVTPHTIAKSGDKTYDSFVLEVDKAERKRFRPSLDRSELQDWAWQPTNGIAECGDVHPGLRQFFREYQF